MKYYMILIIACVVIQGCFNSSEDEDSYNFEITNKSDANISTIQICEGLLNAPYEKLIFSDTVGIAINETKVVTIKDVSSNVRSISLNASWPGGNTISSSFSNDYFNLKVEIHLDTVIQISN